MVPGTHYFFQFAYRNGQGDSQLSDSTEIAFGDYPAAPLPPIKIDESSTLTSIYLQWSYVNATQVNVIGYELWID